MSNLDENKKSAMHGLGRGLDALIPTSDPFEKEVTKPNGMISVDIIEPNPKQPRMEFDEVALAELAASIREHGVIQPLLVSPLGDKYQLIAGDRRLRAAKIAGLTEVPVVERTLNEQSKLELALIENVQRADLNPIEIAASFRKLMEESHLLASVCNIKQGSGMSFGDFSFSYRPFYFHRKREKSKHICNSGPCLSDLLSNIFLGKIKFFHELTEGSGYLDWI